MVEPDLGPVLVDWFKRLAPALFLLLQPVIFYWKILVGNSSTIPFDFPEYHLPLSAYIGKCIRQGIFPFWDPYTYCGMPFHADITAQLFYPFNWVAILLGNLTDGADLLYWLQCQNALHMFLAGVFTFALLRYLGCVTGVALFGGTVYQLGGFFASQAQHLGAICCGAWLPLAWLAILKLSDRFSIRWLSILSLTLGLSILSGFPAMTAVVFVSTGLLATFLVIRRPSSYYLIGCVLAGALLACGLAAVQLLPTMELSRLSVASARGTWLKNGGGLKLQSLVSLLIPNYYNVFTPFDARKYKLPYNFTFLYIYSGMAAVTLFVIGMFLRSVRRLRMFLILTVIAAFWMLGDATPVYRSVYVRLPLALKSPLYAEFASAAFCLALSLTAALTLNHILRNRPGWTGWAVAMLTAVDLIAVSAGHPMNSLPVSWRKITSEHQLSGSSKMLGIVKSLTSDRNPPGRVDFPGAGGVTQITREWETGANMLGVYTSNGDSPFALARTLKVRLLFSSGHYWERSYPIDRPDSPVIDLLNTEYLLSTKLLDEKQMQAARFTRVPNTMWLNIYRNQEVLPRFFLVGKIDPVKSPEEALERLGARGFDAANEAVVEGTSAEAVGGGGKVSVDEFSPNRVQLTVQAENPAFLVTSEAMYPGWNAQIDGLPAKLIMTNAAFRGMAVPRGSHRIVMMYEPRSFRLYAGISVCVLCALLLALAPIRKWTGYSRPERN